MFGLPSLVLWAIGSMLVLGVLFGLGLMLAARVLVPEHDPLVEKVLLALPGINCGACGYAGCEAYAEAVAEGEKVNLCVPGGIDTAAALADLMGVPLEEPLTKRISVLHCQGDATRCGDRFEYVGEQDCLAAHLASGGPKQCIYGCLGLGTCVRACPFDAISINEQMLPVVDPDRCTACGACVEACPRDLYTLEDRRFEIHLGCSSHDRGKAVSGACSVGCIACRRCVKADPHEAIAMVEDLPVLDYEKADGDFRAGAEACPMNCFVVRTPQGQITFPKPEPAAAGAGEAKQG